MLFVSSPFPPRVRTDGMLYLFCFQALFFFRYRASRSVPVLPSTKPDSNSKSTFSSHYDLLVITEPILLFSLSQESINVLCLFLDRYFSLFLGWYFDVIESLLGEFFLCLFLIIVLKQGNRLLTLPLIHSYFINERIPEGGNN